MPTSRRGSTANTKFPPSRRFAAAGLLLFRRWLFFHAAVVVGFSAQVVSAVRLCHPFLQKEFAGLQFTFLEVDKTERGIRLSFFANKFGDDPSDPWGVATMASVFEPLLKLRLEALVFPRNNKKRKSNFGRCSIMMPGYQDDFRNINFRYIARADCDLTWPKEDKKGGHNSSLWLQVRGEQIELPLCPDLYHQPKPASAVTIPSNSNKAASASASASAPSTVSAAICVRSFQSTFFGTNETAVKPHHVTDWLEYHASLGFQRFYLYELVKDDLKKYLDPYLAKNPHIQNMIDLSYIGFLNNSTKTFNGLVTKSYIFDQVMTMQSCFAKARSEGIDLVLHIDFDEYVHTRTPNVPILETLRKDIDKCPRHHSVALERCNVRKARMDPIVTPSDCLWARTYNNVKTAFNATNMALKKQAHNVHSMTIAEDPFFFSEDVYLHHLPDLYAPRSQTSEFREHLALANLTREEEKEELESKLAPRREASQEPTIPNLRKVEPLESRTAPPPPRESPEERRILSPNLTKAEEVMWSYFLEELGSSNQKNSSMFNNVVIKTIDCLIIILTVVMLRLLFKGPGGGSSKAKTTTTRGILLPNIFNNKKTRRQTQ